MPIDVMFAVSLIMFCIAYKTTQPNAGRDQRVAYARSTNRSYKR